MEDIIRRHAGSYNPAFIYLGPGTRGEVETDQNPRGRGGPGAEGTAFSPDVVTGTHGAPPSTRHYSLTTDERQYKSIYSEPTWTPSFFNILFRNRIHLKSY